MLHKGLALAIEAIGVSWLSVNNFPVNIHGIVVLEWRVAGQHFVQKDTKCPPVHGLAVALVQQDLGSNVLWSSANGVGALRYYFGKTKVDHLQVTVASNHDILGLQIPVYNFFALQVFKDRDNLSAVEGRGLGVEVANGPMVRKQVAAL